jgi:aldehyde dehydrogenase (NAD+)
MAPWNYPVNLALVPLVAAVAAGNAVVVKPSEKTPRVAAALAAVVGDTFDSREVAVVQGGPAVAEALLRLPFDHIFFTGGEAKGRAVLQAAAEHLTTTTLELGGKSPAIVLADADLEAAAGRIAWGRFINAGQTCLAPDYVLVEAAVADAFLRHAAAAVARMYPAVGDRPPPDLARIVDEASWTRLASALDEAVRRGARIVTGGHTWPTERQMAPTILTDVPPDSLLLREEIFGPLLPVVAVPSLDDAIASARRRGVPLAVYVFTRDRTQFERAHRGVPAGASVWNQVALHFANPHLPFGGGHGAYHGWFGFRAFSRERAVLHQGRFSLLGLLTPPYGAATGRRLRWLRRLTGGS